jgi:hypothetical protein
LAGHLPGRPRRRLVGVRGRPHSATSRNNQLPPALTAFAPGSTRLSVREHGSRCDSDADVGRRTGGFMPGAGNFERYAIIPSGGWEGARRAVRSRRGFFGGAHWTQADEEPIGSGRCGCAWAERGSSPGECSLRWGLSGVGLSDGVCRAGKGSLNPLLTGARPASRGPEGREFVAEVEPIGRGPGDGDTYALARSDAPARRLWVCGESGAYRE